MSEPTPTPVTAAPPTTGVIFVHGIGTQPERETLFDWSRPMIEVLAEWRREHDEKHPRAVFGENPVTAASVSDPDNPWIEVDIPAFGTRGHERWLLTEAYWARDLRAPSFTDAVGYLKRRLFPIIRGITEGYGARETRRGERIRRLIDKHEDSQSGEVQAHVAELRRSLSRRWALIDGLDKVWQWPWVRAVLAAAGSAIALTALAIYAPLRAIPIEAVRKKVELAAADVFLVDWFGDLPVLLDDPAQAAVVRTRLKERAEWLISHGASKIVLIAHSGGAIVSYASLLRYDEHELPAAKLVTLGQGLALGWRLEHEQEDWFPGNSIRGDLGDHRKDLLWVDVWASYDPAPAGELKGVDDSPLRVRETLKGRVRGSPITVESRPVTNFMHLGLDHGGYWLNDEGFLIPLIRHIDDADGDGSRARFFQDDLARTVRTERRRRRVSILLAWRWAAFFAAVGALAAAVVTPVDLRTTGHGVAAIWSLVPAHELVSGPIDGIGGVIGTILTAIGRADLAATLTDWGPVLLGALVPILAVVIIYSRGVGSWWAHDALERKAIRRESFVRPGRPSARSEGVALVGGLGLVILAAAGLPLAALAIVFLAVAIVSFAIRFGR